MYRKFKPDKLSDKCLKCNINTKEYGKLWCSQCDLILKAKVKLNSFNKIHDI